MNLFRTCLSLVLIASVMSSSIASAYGTPPLSPRQQHPGLKRSRSAPVLSRLTEGLSANQIRSTSTSSTSSDSGEPRFGFRDARYSTQLLIEGAGRSSGPTEQELRSFPGSSENSSSSSASHEPTLLGSTSPHEDDVSPPRTGSTSRGSPTTGSGTTAEDQFETITTDSLSPHSRRDDALLDLEDVIVDTHPLSGLSGKLNLAASGDEREIRSLLDSFSDGFDDFNAHDQRIQQLAIRLVASFLIDELSPLKEDAELGGILVRGTFSSALDSDEIWLGIVRQYNSVFQDISGDKLNSMKLPILHLTNDILARVDTPDAVDLPTYRDVANGDQTALQRFIAPFRGNIITPRLLDQGRQEIATRMVAHYLTSISAREHDLEEALIEGNPLAKNVRGAFEGRDSDLTELARAFNNFIPAGLDQVGTYQLLRLVGYLLDSILNVTEETCTQAQKGHSFAEFILGYHFDTVLNPDPRKQQGLQDKADKLVRQLFLAKKPHQDADLLYTSIQDLTERSSLLANVITGRPEASADVLRVLRDKFDEKEIEAIIDIGRHLHHDLTGKLTWKQVIGMVAFGVIGLGATLADVSTFQDALADVEYYFGVPDTIIDNADFGYITMSVLMLTSFLRLFPSLITAGMTLNQPHSAFEQHNSHWSKNKSRLINITLASLVGLLNWEYYSNAAIAAMKAAASYGQSTTPYLVPLCVLSPFYFAAFTILAYAGLSYEGRRYDNLLRTLFTNTVSTK